MATEQQKYRPTPPPIYNVTSPSGVENEVYIESTSAGGQGGQGRYCVKERQSDRSGCGQLFRFIRSNFLVLFDEIMFLFF